MATLASATVGLTAAVCQVVGEAIRANEGAMIPLLPTLSSTMARRVLAVGIGAGALANLIMAIVDAKSAFKAGFSSKPGLAVLYAGRSLAEISLFARASWLLVQSLLYGAELEVLGGPVVWVITAIIIIISLTIKLFKDPPTLTWTHHCFFGTNPKYIGDPIQEQKDFRKALASGQSI